MKLNQLNEVIQLNYTMTTIKKVQVETPRFKKIQRNVFDLACPWCDQVMGEKDFNFKCCEDGNWTHSCCDKSFRGTEEQEKSAADFKNMFGQDAANTQKKVFTGVIQAAH